MAAALLMCGVAGGLQRGTTANFNETVFATPLTLVAFTAPWCGHCQKLKPELEAASSELLADGVGLVEVDATAERKLAHRFEVRAFPEILVHRRDLGTFAKYGGPRTADGIVAYMRARLGPACAPLSGASADWMALSEPSGEKGVMLLHIYAQPAAADEAHTVSLDQLERAAENVRLHVRCGTPAGEPLQLEARVRVSFARSFSRALAVTESGTVPPVVHYSGPDDSAQILRWITLHSRPAAGELNEQSARAYVGMRDTGVAVLLLPNPLAGRLAVQKEYYAQQLTAVAEAVSVLAGPPVFLAFCHTQGRIGQQLAADYPVDPAVPTLLLLDFTQRARKPAGYKLEVPFEVRAAVEHIALFKAGKLSSRLSVLETLSHFFEWLFILISHHTVEAAVGTAGVFAALIGASMWLDRRMEARAAQQKAALDAAPAADAKDETKKDK